MKSSDRERGRELAKRSRKKNSGSSPAETVREIEMAIQECRAKKTKATKGTRFPVLLFLKTKGVRGAIDEIAAVIDALADKEKGILYDARTSIASTVGPDDMKQIARNLRSPLF